MNLLNVSLMTEDFAVKWRLIDKTRKDILLFVCEVINVFQSYKSNDVFLFLWLIWGILLDSRSVFT